MNTAQKMAGAEVRNYHILLVDDDPDDRENGRRLLKTANEISDVTCFASGTALMEYIKTQGLRQKCAVSKTGLLVLVDLNMPRIDGYHVLQGLKSDPAFNGIPVVVVSGILDYPGMRKAFDLGADGVLRKPLDIVKLRHFMQQHMEGAHGEQG